MPFCLIANIVLLKCKVAVETMIATQNYTRIFSLEKRQT